MGDQDITLTLEKRDKVGKGLNQLRRDGRIPAVIHNHGQDSIVVSAPAIDITKAYKSAGKHHPINLVVGKDKYFTIIKDVDFEPTKQQLRHVVFNAIRQDEKVESEVPIILEGDEIPAEKVGHMVIRQLDHVLIEALPKDLIDSVSVDATTLAEIGDKITVADLKIPEGVTILTEADHPIATVEETKAEMSEEAEEAEGETEGESATEGGEEASEEE